MSKQNDDGQLGSNVTVPPMSPLIMPWFFSASWAPKFTGERRKFGEWQTQMRAMLRAQPLNAQQQVDFVLSTLDGEV